MYYTQSCTYLIEKVKKSTAIFLRKEKERKKKREGKRKRERKRKRESEREETKISSGEVRR